MQGATKVAFTCFGRQEFVAQITVAVFEVDELEATVPGALGGHYIVIDQLANLAVGHDDNVFLGTKATIEQRVLVQHPGFHAGFQVGFAKTARVGQLQANDQVFVAAHAFAVGLNQTFAQLRNARLRLRAHDQLFGVGTAIVTDSDGFAAPNHFGAGPAKQGPATAGVVRRVAIGQTVPAFHGVNGVAVADLESGNRQGLRHGGGVSRFQLVIAGHGQTQSFQVFLEALRA